MSDRVAVNLTGPAQTMLSTLYLKALDADFKRPVLADRFAKAAISRIDYDWDSLDIGAAWAPLCTVRTAQYDIWARRFIARHPQCTVVHLGCGLDARVFRLDPGPDVEWFDVDFPDVIALREKVYPARPHYHLTPTAATDPSWLDLIPADRPVLFLAEGISMYLTEDEGIALLRRVMDRFPSGEIQIDFFNWLAIKSQKTQTLVRRSGSTLYWAVNSPQDVVRSLPGLRLRESATFFDASTFSKVPARYRAVRRAARLAPALRKTAQYHVYEFGPKQVGCQVGRSPL